MSSTHGYTELQTLNRSTSPENATDTITSPSLHSLPSSSNIIDDSLVESADGPLPQDLNSPPSRLASIRHWAGRLIRTGQTSSLRAGAIVDGVFGNLIAKEDARNANVTIGDHVDDDEGLNGGLLISNEDDTPTCQPPTYGEAAADTSPSYWETTMSAFEYADDVAVNGMLVGSFLHFGWNALVSLAFGEVGFFLTYLFHSTYAASAGSMLGFGCTLIQVVLDYQSQIKVIPKDYASEFYPADPNEPDTGGPLSGTVFTTLTDQPQFSPTSNANKTAVCVVMYTIAGMFILKALYDFWWADRRRRLLLRRSREPIGSETESEVQYVRNDHDANDSPV